MAHYTGHGHRLGLESTGHAADVEFMAAARTALPDRLARLDRIRDRHAQWGEQAPHPRTLTGYLDLSRRSVDFSTATPMSIAAAREAG